ncbi:hypothetical protein HG530_011835 [Fusarium avenaceum]|nr:hypothetical protein HG530_011835 [Fusarium avenaceum]
MSTELNERQTIDLPATKDQPVTEPHYLLDDRSTAALKDLQEGDLLQMVVDHDEGVIEFADLNRKVAPDSLGKYFEAPTTKQFAFYRHPESSAVVLIWTRFPAATSVKTTRVQVRLRRELTWYAEREGIETVIAHQVYSQKDITSESLQEAIAASVESGLEVCGTVALAFTAHSLGNHLEKTIITVKHTVVPVTKNLLNLRGCNALVMSRRRLNEILPELESGVRVSQTRTVEDSRSVGGFAATLANDGFLHLVAVVTRVGQDSLLNDDGSSGWNKNVSQADGVAHPGNLLVRVAPFAECQIVNARDIELSNTVGHGLPSVKDVPSCDE